jgi:hypothetical protein
VRLFPSKRNGKYRFSGLARKKENRTMPKLINRPPKYRKHKASGQAIVTSSSVANPSRTC